MFAVAAVPTNKCFHCLSNLTNGKLVEPRPKSECNCDNVSPSCHH
jgi:hypothetical protein